MYWESKTQEVEKEIFYFVHDADLRANLASTLQYCYWLMDQKDKVTNKNRTSLLCRDIIIHFGTIIENILFYTVSEYIRLGKFDGVIFGGKNVWKPVQSIRMEADKTKYIGIFEQKNKIIRFNDQTTFKDLNLLAKKIKIYDQEMYDFVELIRKERNELHCKKEYTKKDFKDVFDKSKRVKNIISRSLESIRAT